MLKWLCNKLKLCFTTSSVSMFLIAVTIVLQTFMIARAFLLMYDVNDKTITIRDDVRRYQTIVDFYSKLTTAGKYLFDYNLSGDKTHYMKFCRGIINLNLSFKNDKFLSETFSYGVKFIKFPAFLNSLSDKCLQNKTINITATLKDIFEYYQNIYRYSVFYYNNKFFKNGIPVSDILTQSIKNLVIVSALISCFIYLLILLIYFLEKRSLNEILKLKKGIDSVPLPVLITDTNANIEYVNQTFQDFYGYTSEEVIGKNPNILKSDKADKNIYSNLWETITSGKKWTGKFINRLKNGEERIIEAYITPIMNLEKKIMNFIGIHRDVTLQTKLMNQLAEAKRQADEANEAKSNFLASMSHEIRTPLNAIVGMADLLDEANLPSEQKRYLEILRSASDSLLSLINDVLDISKIESGKMELEEIDFNLETLAYQVVDLMSVKANKKDIEVICRIGQDTPVNLVGDPTRLRQVLINLIGNAIKFVEKGYVALNIEKEKQDDEKVFIKFTVEDTGIGIPEDKIDKIFDKFAQAETSTTRNYGGTGLGLPISKLIIEKMGGEIKVESKVNKGTKFYFTLPFKLSKRQVTERELADLSDIKGKKVLVIDDNSINKVIVKEILGSYGAIVLDAENGEMGYKLLKEDKDGSIKIIYMDFNMPGLNGYETAKKIMFDENLNNKPVIIPFVSDTITMDRKKFRELGVKYFLSKPVKRKDLIEVSLMAIGGSKSEDKVKDEKEIKYTREELPPLRVLIVDDSPDNRILMKSFLKNSKVEAEFAEDGADAVEKFRNNRYDIIFMDIQMPNMNGYEAVKKIREIEEQEKRNKTHVVALTAVAFKEEVEKALSSGFDDYITKPVRKNNFYAYLINFKTKRN